MEKYGEIPKAFTKKWVEHYWTYYKFHALAVIFACFMVGSIIYANVTRITYDLCLGYVGKGYISENYQQKFTEWTQDLIVDSAEDGRKDIRFTDYAIDYGDLDDKNIETESAIRDKLVLDIMAGDGDLFFVTGTNLQYLKDIGDCFEEANSISGTELRDDQMFKNDQGYAFAVKLNTTDEIYQSGFDLSSGLYLCVRKVFADNTDIDGRQELHENSVKIARMLIGE